MLMAYEVTRDLPVIETEVETPMAKARGTLLEGKKIVLVPILRAGTGMVRRHAAHPALGARGPHRHLPRPRHAGRGRVLPQAARRDERPRRASWRIRCWPPATRPCAAIDRVKHTQPRSIRFVCLVAAPEGVANFHESHPDVPIYTAAIDEHLDEHGYIVPGLGDAGDRLFGTK